MPDGDQPSVDDIRGVFRLLNECLELWADPDAWQQHLLLGVRGLVDTPIGQLQLMQPTENPDRPRIIPLAWSGENETARRLYHASTEPESGVELPAFSGVAAPAIGGGSVGLTRRMAVPDHAWYESRWYKEFVEPSGVDEFGIGMSFAPSLGCMLMLGGNRTADADPIPPVTAATLAILAEELVPLLGTRLALADQTSMSGLSPRQRQTLELLLDGLSEKQVAAEMGIKQSTAHGYIVELHRHFDVSSRGELLSYFVRRRPVPPPASD
ncbi:MAG: helix-turn-helix transcriptional regulator [Phycisphaerales bacterium JB037]